MIQQRSPVKKRINVINDTSSADFVFQVLNNCGKKAIVVSDAAENPYKSI